MKNHDLILAIEKLYKVHVQTRVFSERLNHNILYKHHEFKLGKREAIF